MNRSLIIISSRVNVVCGQKSRSPSPKPHAAAVGQQIANGHLMRTYGSYISIPAAVHILCRPTKFSFIHQCRQRRRGKRLGVRTDPEQRVFIHRRGLAHLAHAIAFRHHHFPVLHNGDSHSGYVKCLHRPRYKRIQICRWPRLRTGSNRTRQDQKCQARTDSHSLELFSQNSYSARAFLRNPPVVLRKSALIKPRFCHTPKSCSRGSSLLAPYCRYSLRSDPPFSSNRACTFSEKSRCLFLALKLAHRARGSVFIFPCHVPVHLSSVFSFVLFRRVRVSADDISKISPSGYVTDSRRRHSAGHQTRLEALGIELEQKTGAQMAIVTVRSLDDRPDGRLRCRSF